MASLLPGMTAKEFRLWNEYKNSVVDGVHTKPRPSAYPMRRFRFNKRVVRFSKTNKKKKVWVDDFIPANGSGSKPTTSESAKPTAAPSPAPKPKSQFLDTPIYIGPFHQNKYGNPMARITASNNLQKQKASKASDSKPSSTQNSWAEIGKPSLETSNFSDCKAMLNKGGSTSAVVQHSTVSTATPRLLPLTKCASTGNQAANNNSTNQGSPLPTEPPPTPCPQILPRSEGNEQSHANGHVRNPSAKSASHLSEVTPEPSALPQPAHDQTLSTQEVSSQLQATSLSISPTRKSSSTPTQVNRPVNKGRALPDSQIQPQSNLANMSASSQAKRFSMTSPTAHPGELPNDHLHRIQRLALMESNIKSRRQNKHDTAFPEVLAFIRKPLDIHVNEAVEYRVSHYWRIGNENLPVTTSVGVEPEWPAGENDFLSNPDHIPQKRLKELMPPTSSGRVDSSRITRPSNSRWVSGAEVRAPAQRPNSNAWGSGPSTETGANSHDSVRAEGKPKDIHYEPNLAGWDGKMQPPPVDWHDRPRFDNKTVDQQNSFNNWAKENLELVTSHSFNVIDSSEVLDVSNHADGIGFVPATASVTAANAWYYGYRYGKEEDKDFFEIVQNLIPLTAAELTAVSVIQVDSSIVTSLADETTEYLVQRWIGQRGWLNNKRVPIPKTPKLLPPPSHYQPSAAPRTPELRISLRPATISDIPGMTDIYNWYVENSTKTAEYEAIDTAVMRSRLDDVKSSKLPIIVAVARNRGRASDYGYGSMQDARRPNVNRHPVNNTNPAYQGMTQQETILGWACASDLTADDYVERITAECELYVAQDSRQLGVGTALMDKLLDACDRGYVKLGKYDWRCAPEIQHMYSGGGGRDLHKMYFVIRKYNKPKVARSNRGASARSNNGDATKKPNDQEDEYDAWLKGWMESWGFEQEGMMKQVGVKNKRFLDAIHMGRETGWQPQEGHIPDPLPGSS